MAEICSECGTSFPSPADLVEHARSHATAPAAVPGTRSVVPHWFRCTQCDAWFLTAETLAEHTLAPHRARALPRRRVRRVIPQAV